MKLINKIKPEILDSFEQELRCEYSSSYRVIIAALENARDYRELTVEDLKTITCFLPDEFKPKGYIDYFYGDNILSKDHQL